MPRIIFVKSHAKFRVNFNSDLQVQNVPSIFTLSEGLSVCGVLDGLLQIIFMSLLYLEEAIHLYFFS